MEVNTLKKKSKIAITLAALAALVSIINNDKKIKESQEK